MPVKDTSNIPSPTSHTDMMNTIGTSPRMSQLVHVTLLKELTRESDCGKWDGSSKVYENGGKS